MYRYQVDTRRQRAGNSGRFDEYDCADADTAALIEIDENLCRNELTTLEVGILTTKRAELPEFVAEGMTSEISEVIPSKTHPKKAVPGGPKAGGSTREIAELTGTDLVRATKRRPELVAAVEKEKGVQNDGDTIVSPSKQQQRRAGIKTGHDTGSTREIADLTGQSRETVRRAAKVGKVLSEADVDALESVGTTKLSELAKVAALPEPERKAVIA